MSSKEDEPPSHAAPTTPRRLRSGTQFGEQSSGGNKYLPTPKSTQQAQVKKETFPKKTGKNAAGEKSSALKSDGSKSGCENARSKEGQMFHSSSSSRSTSSPKQQPKSQTLKAILESIEPNALLKSKATTKRKTLRDLLNQKSFQQEKGERSHSPSKKAGVNFANFAQGKESKTTGRDEKNADYKSSSETVHVFTTSLDSSFRETSEYTHLACSSSEQAAGFSASSTVYSPQVVVKQEPPDDYWLMRNDYIDKDRSSSSLQVNVKTECFMTSDEVGGQTLRISCTKPEDIDSSSNGPTALRSDVKPDIVLKVKPRSSSLLTLARAASDFYIASKKDAENSVKPESNSEDVKPSFSPTYSAPVLTPETDRSFCHTSVSTDDSFGESSHPKLSMILKEAHPDTAGEYPGNDQTTDSKISLQQLEPVLEESTLPPVANTVELLTEPHDYLHGNLNHCNVTLNGSERQARLDGYESDSPGPPVLEPITLIKTEPAEYLDETSGTLGIKQEVKQDWNERDKEDEGTQTGENTTDCAPGISWEQPGRETRHKPERGGKRMEDRGKDRARDSGHPDEGGDAGHMATATVVCQSETGSRRRRKGRPSRRARSDGQWSTGDFYSPRYDSDNYDDMDPTPEDKSPARTSSTPVTRKGKRQGESNTGSGRRGRKSMDLETLWANPQLDTHAFLLWARSGSLYFFMFTNSTWKQYSTNLNASFVVREAKLNLCQSDSAEPMENYSHGYWMNVHLHLPTGNVDDHVRLSAMLVVKFGGN
ncbi:hypothetical protein BaRGS_00040340 [Batillaria attramentaria]|uniref:Uncharacterized protein n=1 Tax=Batillaria attramentaria TaxID=370345 RepID=A0ABD0J0H2_9CAEN